MLKAQPSLRRVGLGGQPQRELDEVGKDLVALALEVVLGRPQGVVAELVHGLGESRAVQKAWLSCSLV